MLSLRIKVIVLLYCDLIASAFSGTDSPIAQLYGQGHGSTLLLYCMRLACTRMSCHPTMQGEIMLFNSSMPKIYTKWN